MVRSMSVYSKSDMQLTRDRAIVKEHIPDIAFFILNVTFISFIQSILLFAISGVPAYAILLSNQFEKDITAADIAYLVVQLSLVLSEFISDGQQQSKFPRAVESVYLRRLTEPKEYQTAKHQYKKDGKVPEGFKQADLDRGFNTTGLWAYSRHPNFFAEQLIWFVLYQWSCFATNNLFSWTFAGSAALILLFQGSTWLTELITTKKYEEYELYQRNVGMFLPTSTQGYKTPTQGPKVIRTSELAKRQALKETKQN
jgi:steroid 5-alpha reductase family enzyme